MQYRKGLVAPGLAGEKSDFFSILLGVGCGAREEKRRIRWNEREWPV